MELVKQCHSAAELLAAAVLDYNPKAWMVQGGEASPIFYYDFVFGASVPKEVLPLIEERMRHLASLDLPLEVKEMVPFSGAEFLRHKKRHHRAKRAEKVKDPLIQILHIGEFVDYITGDYVETTKEIFPFKLLRLEKRPDLEGREVHRIVGVIAKDKQELKALVKKGVEDPLDLGEKKGLFVVERSRNSQGEEEEKIYWNPKGEELIYALQEEWRKKCLEEGYELVLTPDQNHEKLYKLLGKSCQEGPVLFAEWHFPTSTQSIFSLKKDLEEAKKRFTTPFEITQKGEVYLLTKKMSQKKELFCRITPYDK